VADDELVPVQRDVDPDTRPVGVLLPVSKTLDKSTLPIYRPIAIHVRLDDDALALPPSPRKVYIEGKDLCFFKQIPAGDVGTTVIELATYIKIYAADFGEDVRVSRLLGVVEDEHMSRVVGILLSYIDCENMTLSCATRGSEHTLRDKWLKQMTHSLHELHARQIVWGDAKPDNVLVDVHGDAYLIDFGGGYTRGWVEKEKVNIREGDLQGLKRIAAYLTGVS
jgi:serine/threonine protein kinase